MSIIIKLQGLPLEANSVDVRLYFLGLTIPDGGVHIVGGEEGTVFIEFASDEDARQAMARGAGTIKNSSVKLLLSSKNELQSVIDAIHQKHRDYVQQQSQLPQQPVQQQSMILPQVAQQPWCPLPQPQNVPFLPWAQQVPQPPLTQASLLPLNQALNVHDHQQPQHLLLPLQQPQQQQQQQPQQQQQQQQQQPFSQNNNRVRGVSGMRGGDDKLFTDKRCVLAASNIPYRATSRDIIEFLADFGIGEESIRRRYNQKGQPTADAKIAFPTPEAAMKAMKMMNKKSLCGRPVFFKPV